MADDRPPSARSEPTNTDGLLDALEELMPRSLDDIVRKNRDRVQIGLARREELAVRAATIEPGRVKDTITDWRMIAFRALGSPGNVEIEGGIGNSSLVLLGRATERRCGWITSAVMQIDADNGLVLTRNSLYGLGVKAEGEPPREELVFVCATLHRWGFGEVIGAPEFLY